MSAEHDAWAEEAALAELRHALANNRMAVLTPAWTRALLALSARASEWMPIAGVPRDQLPGTLIGWCVGYTEHSDARWRREGAAILTLHNDGPLGFSRETIRHARWLLDMSAIEEVTLYRSLPSPPLSSPGGREKI